MITTVFETNLSLQDARLRRDRERGDHPHHVGAALRGVQTPRLVVNCWGFATAADFLPIGDVGLASVRKGALRGGTVTGHNRRQRVWQASHQATEAGPGRCRRLDRMDRSREVHPRDVKRFLSRIQSGDAADPLSHQASHHKNLQVILRES